MGERLIYIDTMPHWYCIWDYYIGLKTHFCAVITTCQFSWISSIYNSQVACCPEQITQYDFSGQIESLGLGFLEKVMY